MRNRLMRGLFAAALATGLFSGAATGQEAAGKAPRDGQHDFDFELGSWKIDLKRRLRRLRPLTNRLEPVG